jgi:hypothetical protein
MVDRAHSGRLALMVAAALLALFAPHQAAGADSTPQLVLNTSKATPRSVESLTERAILRDYKFAWVNLDQAMESNSTAFTTGLFAGTAGAWLNDAVASQRRSGLSSRYLNQAHKVEAVFYAPEGDVIELHDTAEYDLQVLDGNKTIHNEHAIVHYVVLVTPGADRWVIRQLQSVPEF